MVREVEEETGRSLLRSVLAGIDSFTHDVARPAPSRYRNHLSRKTGRRSASNETGGRLTRERHRIDTLGELPSVDLGGGGASHDRRWRRLACGPNGPGELPRNLDTSLTRICRHPLARLNGGVGQLVRIETDRLLVRSFSISDLPAYAEIVADPRVTKFLADGSPHTYEMAEAYILDCIDRDRATGISRYAVLRKRETDLIGFAGSR